MAGLQWSQERALNARGTILNAVTDSPVAIRMRYIGTGTVTSVTVTTATNIVTVTTEGTKTYAFGTYTTLATLIAAIKADGIFEVKILDALTTQSSASNLLDGAITSGFDGNGNIVWDVKQDTSAAKQLIACISPFRDFDSPKGHRVHVQEIKYNATLGAAGANNVVIVSRNPRTNVETTLISYASASAAVTTLNWASGNGKITANVDQELICQLKDGTSIADAAANYFSVAGIYE